MICKINLALLCLFSFLYSIEEKLIIVVTASYNNKDVCRKNLHSLLSQEYENWKLIYMDDGSTDGTGDLVESLLHQHRLENRVTLIRNPTRKGQLYNQYHAIHSCPKDAIIFILDGDDWLAAPWTLAYINEIYQTKDIWLTYGQFIYSSTHYIGYCLPIPQDLWPKNPIRTLSWVTSHPRTFYAGLFQKIALEDLLCDGKFFPVCADLATMFPMLEMAGPDHVQYIDSILYVYNDNDPTHRCDESLQRKLGAIIRSKKPYPLLSATDLRAFDQTQGDRMGQDPH